MDQICRLLDGIIGHVYKLLGQDKFITSDCHRQIEHHRMGELARRIAAVVDSGFVSRYHAIDVNAQES
jgi:hypothetical protein